jgi:hypothetical protein
MREGKLDVHDARHELTSVWQKIRRMHMPSPARPTARRQHTCQRAPTCI